MAGPRRRCFRAESDKRTEAPSGGSCARSRADVSARQKTLDSGERARSRSSVPKRRNSASFRRAAGLFPGRQYTLFRGAGEYVGATLDGHRSLSVFTQRQTGHAQNRRLFLHTAGIGKDDGGICLHTKKIEIAERFKRVN